MKPGKNTNASNLRQKAEEQLQKHPLKADKLNSEADNLKLIHELEVAKIELEMQNEELETAKDIAEYAAENYTELYDFAPTGYLTLTGEGEVIRLNHQIANMLNKKRSELIHSRFSFFVSNDSKPIFNLFLDKIFASKARLSCELTLEVEGKPLQYVILNGVKTSRSEQCLLSVIDITERKQIEDVQTFLLHSGYAGTKENFFESLAQYLAQSLKMDYVCIDKLIGDGLNAQTLAIYNDSNFDANISYTLMDTPCGEVVGKNICCFSEGVSKLFPRDATLRELRAESYIGTTLWSFDGKPIGLIAIIGRDPLKNASLAESVLKLVAIRAAAELERLQAEEALKESEKRFRAIFEQAGIGVALINSQTGQFVRINQKYCDFVGYTESEMLQKTFMDITYDEDIQQNIDNNKRLVDGKTTLFSFEKRYLHKDGTIIWGNLTISPLWKQNEKPNEYFHIAIVENINERKQFELTINQQNLELQKLNADKTRFMNILSHDLRSPFGSVVGLLNLLAENIRKYDLDEIEKLVTLIKISSQNTYDLIKDLLMWSTAQAGKIPFNPQQLDFTTICTEVLEILKPNSNDKSITIKHFVAEGITVFADKDMLKTVLRNLISNAIKFTNKGGAIDVFAEQDDAFITITVSDNGIGLTPEIAANLFDISQIHSVPGTEKERGTGLGLMICKEFVERHGGKIWVKNTLGAGSEFVITLPKSITH